MMSDPIELFPWIEPFLWGMFVCGLASILGDYRAARSASEQPCCEAVDNKPNPPTQP